MQSSESNTNTTNLTGKRHSSSDTSFIHSTNTSKGSIHFGSDAAASYYFADEPKTPAVKIAKKKMDKQQRRSEQFSALETTGEENNDPNLSFLSDVKKIETGTNSTLNRASGSPLGFINRDDEDTACLLADHNLNASSSSSTHENSIDEDDTMNKSVLSDTTELKASTFVFFTDSTQRFMDEKSKAQREASKANNRFDKLASVGVGHGTDVSSDNTLELLSGVLHEDADTMEQDRQQQDSTKSDDTASISDVLSILRTEGTSLEPLSTQTLSQRKIDHVLHEEDMIEQSRQDRDSSKSDETASISDVLKILRTTSRSEESSNVQTSSERKIDPPLDPAKTVMDGIRPFVDSDHQSNFMTDNTEELLNWSDLYGSPSVTAVSIGVNAKEKESDDETIALFARVSSEGFNRSNSKATLDTPGSQGSFKDKAESIRSLTESIKKANHRQVVNKERRLSRMSLGNLSSASLSDHVYPPPTARNQTLNPSLERSYSMQTSTIFKSSSVSNTIMSTFPGSSTSSVQSPTIPLDKAYFRSEDTTKEVNMRDSTDSSLKLDATLSGSKRKQSSSPHGSVDKMRRLRLQSSGDTAELDALLDSSLNNSSSSVDTSLLLSPMCMETTESHSHPSKTVSAEETANKEILNARRGTLKSFSDENSTGQLLLSADLSSSSPDLSATSFPKDQSRDMTVDTVESNSIVAAMTNNTQIAALNSKDRACEEGIDAMISTNSSQRMIGPSSSLSQNSDSIPASMNDPSDTQSSPADLVRNTGRFATPKSILNNSRRGSRSTQYVSITKKTVAFGSPEYAEYNIGSPSTNLTPIPTRTRVIEGSPSILSTESQRTSPLKLQGATVLEQDETVGLECDIDSMLLATGTRVLSDTNSDDKTVELDLSLNQLLNTVGHLRPINETSAFKSDLSQPHNSDQLSTSRKGTLGATNSDDKTVDLDSSLNHLLHTVGDLWPTNETSAFKSDLSQHHNSHRLSTMSMSFDESFSMDLASRRESDQYLERLLSSTLDSRPPNRRVSLASRKSLSFSSSSSLGDADVSTESSGISQYGFSPNETSDYTSNQSEIIDMTWKEITNLVGPKLSVLGDSQDLFLNQLNNISQHPIVFDDLQGFLYEACTIMENYSEGEVIDGEDIFRGLLQDHASSMIFLQRSLRSHGPMRETVLKLLTSLSDLTRSVVSSDIRNWEAEVSKALVLLIAQTLDEMDVELHEINRRIKLADEVNASLFLLSGQAIKRARRKSMSRRQVSAETIQRDISELEKEVAVELEALSFQKVENEKNKYLSDLVQVKHSLVYDFIQLKNTTESNFSKLKSLELLHDFSLVRVENSSTVRFHNLWNESQLSFQFTETAKGLVCRPTLDNQDCPSKEKSQPRQVYFNEEVSEFLERKTTSYVNQLSYLSGASETILNVGFFVSRLQLIGREISKLLRRFTGKLTWSEDVSLLHLSLLFVQRKNACKGDLVASFHLDLSYPFSPLEVDLTGDINTEELEQHLIKNAKPGIGYLTRSCDVISAFLRSHT